ncbi:hypothetical protein BEWA_032690 [Theileria equi strain WA]|uniref:Uncharacterized protein n=1 Tax=Theileria equi strain WA TaxID=1537102 RepID=L0AZK0_THEEQ|nr:hypothetical protein BEWA_032690 [Theileria equi strain WA]AFZ80416.1 hypothetical protein BEWA_032690 [Theileria equi strain WA]|eukprot:XP_004830082.1 hypothetical protein BEWA_032690 [Theileria equi strain WA]
MDPLEILESRCEKVSRKSQGSGESPKDLGDAKPRVKSVQEFTYSATAPLESPARDEDESLKGNRDRKVGKTAGATHSYSKLKVAKSYEKRHDREKTDEYGRRLRPASHKRDKGGGREADRRSYRREERSRDSRGPYAETKTQDRDKGEPFVSAIDRMALRREELLKKHSQRFIDDVKLVRESQE